MGKNLTFGFVVGGERNIGEVFGVEFEFFRINME